MTPLDLLGASCHVASGVVNPIQTETLFCHPFACNSPRQPLARFFCSLIPTSFLLPQFVHATRGPIEPHLLDNSSANLFSASLIQQEQSYSRNRQQQQKPGTDPTPVEFLSGVIVNVLHDSDNPKALGDDESYVLEIGSPYANITANTP